MSDELNSGVFHVTDLTPTPPLKYPVVLNSGGPIMELISEDSEGFCLVSWGGTNNDQQTETFPSECLFRCLPYLEKS